MDHQDTRDTRDWRPYLSDPRVFGVLVVFS